MDDGLTADLARDLDAAFERLVRAHQDRVYSIALRIVGRPDDAEEIAQDAFVRAYRAIASYDPPRIRALELRPWLATIVVNLCRNRLRRKTIPTVRLDDPPAEPVAPDRPNSNLQLVSTDPLDRPEELATRRESADEWGRVLAGLPARYRVPIVLRHVDGLGYDEMAAVLGRPEGTLKAQVHRGLALLRTAALRTARVEREEMTA